MIGISNDAFIMNAKRSRIAAISKAFRAAFDLLIVFYGIAVIAAISMLPATIPSWSGETLRAGVSFGLHLAAFALIGAVLCLCVLVLKEASEDSSPFSASQAHRMRVIAGLFLAMTVLAVAQGVLDVLSASSVLGMNYAFLSGKLGFGVQIFGISASIVSFFLSYVFEYGALLQWLADETV